jgi:putative acetyltransferase
MDIRQDDLSSEATKSLIRLHLEGMHAASPPGHVFALDYSGLQTPDVTVWSAWVGEHVVGLGALKQLDGETGEIKSMRTHPDHLRKGVGAILLERIIIEANARRLKRLSLETGSDRLSNPPWRSIASAVSSTAKPSAITPRATSISSSISIWPEAGFAAAIEVPQRVVRPVRPRAGASGIRSDSKFS